MQARVETAVDGGTLELVYTTDPKYVDGLSQEEIVANILGLIPALLYATTYVTVDESALAEYLRNHADVWDPPGQYISEQAYTYWEGEH